MKYNKIKYMLMATAMVVLGLGGLTACTDDAHDELEGIYAAPTDLTITSATTVDKTKEGSLRTFMIQFNTQEGITVNMKLVSNQYYLTGTTFTYATAAAAKNGNYIDGSSINGSAVTSGSLVLVRDGDNYTVSTSVLWTGDGKVYRLKGAVTLVYEPDDPTFMTVLKSAKDNGDGTVTAIVSTGGYTEYFDMTTYQNVYVGEGYDWQIVFNSVDGKLHEGTYAPGTGYVVGYTYEASMFGYTWTDYAGTLWYSVADGAKVPSLITTGDIKVTKSGSQYTILIDQGKGGVYAQYNGKIEDLDPDGAAEAQELTFGGGVNWTGWGGSTVAVGFAGPGASIEFSWTTFSFVPSETGIAFSCELYSTDGTLDEGTYVADAEAATPGTYKNGVVYVDGKATETALEAITIAKDGENYIITTTIAGVDYQYTGPISF